MRRLLVNILVSIDQLGNVLAGGNPDNTISARVGYYTEKYYDEGKVPAKWIIFRNIINFTFYPIDGENHCQEAYYNDAGTTKDEDVSDLAIAVLAIFIILSCIPLSIIFYLLYALRIVSPRYINRTENVKRRLRSAEGRLQGVYNELNKYKVKVDEELDNILDETQEQLEEIAQKIEGVLNLRQRLQVFKSKKSTSK